MMLRERDTKNPLEPLLLKFAKECSDSQDLSERLAAMYKVPASPAPPAPLPAPPAPSTVAGRLGVGGLLGTVLTACESARPSWSCAA